MKVSNNIWTVAEFPVPLVQDVIMKALEVLYLGIRRL